MAARPRDLLRGAALCAFAFVVMLGLAYGSSRARHIDASALQGFFGLQRPRVTELTRDVAKIGDPLWTATIALVLAAVAALRGRLRVSLFVLAYVAATSVSSQVLKALLAYPRDSGLVDHVSPSSAAFPSGHSTAAMTIAIALVVVVPRRLRPLAAMVGTAIAMGVSFSVVSMGWHFPSDAIGGYLLAAGWAFVLLAALRAADLRWPARTVRGALARTADSAVEAVAGVGLVLTVFAGTVAAAVLLMLRRADTVAYADDHTAFVVVAALLALSVVALMAGLTRALTRRA